MRPDNLKWAAICLRSVSLGLDARIHSAALASLTEITLVASIDYELKGGANESAQRPSLPLLLFSPLNLKHSFLPVGADTGPQERSAHATFFSTRAAES